MSEQKLMKNFEELRFSDDFMFCRVMEDPALCREVLECLLQHPVADIGATEIQKEIRHSSETKMIRLDVFNEDRDGVLYDAELQNLNKKSVVSHQLPRRSRYYQSSIDTDYMKKGFSYKRLPESNVLFICTFDPFEKGLSKYTSRERCEEDPEIQFGDGTTKIFYNCCYKGEDIPEDLRQLYYYVETGIADSSLTKRLEAAVVEGRKNEMWRDQYMREWNVINDAVEEAVEDAKEEARENDIIAMLRRGKTVEEIVDFCGFPYDQVKKVEENLLATAK